MLPIERLAEWFGSSPETTSQSRRHGHRNRARRDVENVILYELYGVSIDTLRAQTGLSRRGLQASLQRGRSLLARGLERGSLAGLDPSDDAAE